MCYISADANEVYFLTVSGGHPGEGPSSPSLPPLPEMYSFSNKHYTAFTACQALDMHRQRRGPAFMELTVHGWAIRAQ